MVSSFFNYCRKVREVTCKFILHNSYCIFDCSGEGYVSNIVVCWQEKELEYVKKVLMESE